MKIIRCISDQTPPDGAWGRLDGDSVRLYDRAPWNGGTETGTVVPAGEIRRTLAPADPPNVVAIGVNYKKHIEESGKDLPDAPVIFLKATTSVIGPEDPIRLPKHHPDEVDYEAELAIIIGTTARHVPAEGAAEVIFGYTCANDVSARDCQLRLDTQWARGKSFDTFCPLGPVIETELDPADLRVACRLNGETMQESSTRFMIFDVGTIVAHVTACMTCPPGTVILTGTPEGVGFARSPQRFLRDGDRCEIEVEGIGTLRNPVERET
jgi:2-keto-4-pentenoate hydratase/2-oxohepta-3-ene-1,7-dioic acid hydratase in catechol pathway